MSASFTTFNYWPTIEPHFMENTDIEEEKSRFLYHPMFLINAKDPTLFDKTYESEILTPLENATVKNEKIDLPVTKLPKNIEKNRPFKCLQCSKSFLLKHHLTTHEKTHTGERPHICKHCGKSFTHKYCLNTHLLLHSNDRPYQCIECKKSFTLKHHLISHKRVHKREKPFICNQCGKSFPLKKQLITHEKFHKGERPFVCNECGDSFAKENHLIMHLRFHGSINSFACRDCGATFTRKFELVNHEKVHGKEPLSCPVCHKEFLQKRTLANHVKSHTTHYPPSCTCIECGINFQTQNDLMSHHNVLHQNIEKPIPNNGGFSIASKSKNIVKPVKNKKYFCDICFRKFSAKHGLTQHKKRQHGSGSCNVFNCNLCSKSFTQKHHLMSHHLQHNNNPSIPSQKT